MDPNSPHLRSSILQDEGKELVRSGFNDQSYPQFRHDELWNRTHAPIYPMYMSGGGYVVSDDVLQKLFIVLDIAGTEVIERGPEDSGTVTTRRLRSSCSLACHRTDHSLVCILFVEVCSIET